MAAFATTAQLEAAWRQLTAKEALVADTLLNYASTMLRASVADLDARIAAGSLDASLVRLATIQMVKRVLEHPSTAVESQTTGPYTIRYRENAIGLLEITASEWKLLRPSEKTVGSSVGAVRMKPGLW